MRRPLFRSILVLALLLLLTSCDSSSDPALDGDVPDGDTPDGDVPDGDWPDGDADGDVPDGDTSDGDDADGDEGPDCEMPDTIPLDDPDLEQKKFALSMFHFNVQYVAGGLEVMDGEEAIQLCGPPCAGWSDERLIDWVITETFEPVLDLYLAHPTWRATFEMQAMMLEAIGERHPELLEKVRAGAQSGQIELVSFHYSAQFFLAFPERDLQRSVDMTRKIFNDLCVPLSGTVFNQEGQAGEGKHAFMAKNGYDISVFPKNLFRYVQNDVPRWPWYEDRGVNVVIGPGEADPESGIDVTWTFFDDGELLAYPLDPYFAPFANPKKRAEELLEYETTLTALEESGYKITSLTDYVNHLRAQEIERRPLPQVIDGTWQPTSTSSVSRWLGGRSQAPYNNHERDNDIRTENYRVSQLLAAVAVLLSEAETVSLDTTGLPERLDAAYRNLFKSQVSDATGITPWRGEFLYGVEHNAAARAEGEALRDELLTLLDWPFAEVNLETGHAEEAPGIPTAEPPIEADPPLDLTVSAPTRETTVEWFEAGADAWQLVFTFGPAADTTGKDAENARVSLAFSRYDETLRYSPALLDDEVISRPFSGYVFQRGEVYLPLANGLIGLGDDWWVVQDCRYTRLAAWVGIKPDVPFVELIDETASPDESRTWRILVVKGSEDDALAVARRTNTHPVIYYSRDLR